MDLHLIIMFHLITGFFVKKQTLTILYSNLLIVFLMLGLMKILTYIVLDSLMLNQRVPQDPIKF